MYRKQSSWGEDGIAASTCRSLLFCSATCPCLADAGMRRLSKNVSNSQPPNFTVVRVIELITLAIGKVSIGVKVSPGFDCLALCQ